MGSNGMRSRLAESNEKNQALTKTLAMLDHQPGTYAFVLGLPTTELLRVGRLGVFRFSAGLYVYVGSALGPGGVAARLRHHCRKAARPRWHIDYLRQVSEPLGAWVACSDIRNECRWVGRLATLPQLMRPMTGFGASDCRCSSHLFLAETKTTDELRPVLAAHLHGADCGFALLSEEPSDFRI